MALPPRTGQLGVRGPLVPADILADALDEVDVLDVRWTLGGPPGIEGFMAGHVPGARYADLETVFAQVPADPVDERGRHPLPDPGELADALAALGLAGERPVVLVDGGNLMAAARAWWVLRWLGWPPEAVAVLDGGQAAWDAAGLPVETGAGVQAAPAQQRRRAAVGGQLPVVDADAAARLARNGRLLDARAPARWRGDIEPVDPRAGHIPGAINLPWDVDLGADGRFRPPSELRALLAAAGFDDGEPLAVSCGSGVSAAHLVLAAEVAGLPLPALYPGSFSGWCADPDHPVEVSPLPI
jgi:thiosulfate/3-mercaptopyruvate sulfurtransferase